MTIQKTRSIKAGEIQQDWLLYDANSAVLGRLASKIAFRLRGKHKPTFTPHLDVGDFVVVINARKVRVTGSKESNKIYYRHSGYPGGLKEKTLSELRKQHPDRIIKLAVKGMLPKGPLGRQMLSKLKVYSDGTHPHIAQNPRQQTI